MGSASEIQSLIARFAEGPDVVAGKIKGLLPEQMTYRPFSEAWTIHEHLVHLADSEINGSVRLRKILAESGVGVDVFDQEKWARGLNYHAQAAERALTLFRLLREISTELLSQAGEEQWEANFVVHPERGKLTLRAWVKLYAEHVDQHVSFIERNLRLWQERGKAG